MKIDLNGKWKMCSSQYADLEATVPGSVLSTLLAHKLIEDPFYRDNESKVRQCLKDNYTFKRSFILTEEQLLKHNYLFIDGIDTLDEWDTDKLVYVKLTDMEGNFLSENFYQHCADKDITYPEANISVKAVDAYTVEVTADAFVRNVFLQCGGTDRIFSDNFFNLLKNEPKTITSNAPLDMDKLTVMSVNQVKFVKEGGEL